MCIILIDFWLVVLSANEQPFKTNTNKPLSIIIINILTWIWAFQDKPLYLVVFSLCSSLFWELRDKRNFKKIHLWPESLGAMSEYWHIECGQTQNHVCACHFFCSQVFKTSDVLNSDENIVNIAFITFCLLVVPKLAPWQMSSLLLCGVGLWPIVCNSCRLF